MRKIVLFLAAALFCGGVFFFSGCGKKEEKPKVIRVAMDATFPPYEYYDNGKIVGIDVEIIREIARVAGYEVEILDTKFSEVIPGVKSGKWEVGASGLTITHERRMDVDFTIPYETAYQVIIVPSDSKLQKTQDLKDASIRIGVQSGTTGDACVAKELHAPVPFASIGLAFTALEEGKLDAVVCDSEPAELYCSGHPGAKILPEAFAIEEYAFAISRNNPGLLKDFNAVIVGMKASGRLRAILNKYHKPAKP